MTAGAVHFSILGPLEVTRDGHRVDLGGPRPRTLVAMLLVDANRVVSADRLIDGIWGEDPPLRVVTGLQVLISNLRRALEPDRAAREPARILVTRPPGYLLAVEPHQLDAARFEALVAGGRRLLDGRQPAAALETLAEAIALWRGPALAEVAGEDFARPAAVRLEELLVVAREDRIQAVLDLGRHGAAVPALEALVLEHPLRERLWGLLMLAYYRSGRQADALRTFATARLRLGEELGIDPGPDLQRLEADILAQAPALDWHPGLSGHETPYQVAPGPESPAPPLPATAPPPPARRLVGRGHEQARLAAALGEAAGGEGRLVLLSGGAGVGKTRLVDDLTRRATAEGALVGWGRCHEGDSAPPFWPWIQVLRAITTEVGVDLDGLPEPVAAALVQFVPDLPGAPAAAATASPSDAAHARAQLFQALATLLVQQAAGQSLVLVVDDLQWADAPSLELFTFLAAQVGRSRLLLLGTFRDADVDHDHPLCHALASLTRHPWTERLALDGLTRADVADLVAGLTGADPPADLADAIHRRTDGNPFFVVELVRLLEGSGSLAAGDAGAALRAPVPLGVRDVIRQRIAQLPPEARTVLSAAAVAGPEFDDGLLADAGAGDEDAVLTALELAMARRLVGELPGTVGRFKFVHGLIQETIYEGLSATRRARLHAAVAAALERRPGPAQAADLAHHLWYAAAVTGPSPAVHAAVRAADDALAHLAHERAEEQLDRALSLVSRLPAGEAPSAELAIQARWGRLLAALRGPAASEVRAAFSRARQLCDAAGAGPDEQVATRWGLFYSLYVGGNMTQARAVAGELLERGGEAIATQSTMAGHLAVGIAEFHVGALAAAEHHLALAVELAGPQAGPATQVETFQVDPRVYGRCFLALVLALTGASGADSVAAAARAVAATADHPFSAATAALFSTWLGFVLGDPAAARRHGADTVAVAERHGYRMLAAAGAVFEGWAMARQGEAAAGASRLHEAVESFESLGSPLGQTLFRIAMADADHRAGWDDEALATVRQLLDRRADGTAGHYYDAELHRLYAELLAAQGSAGLAREHLDRAVDIARAQGARTLEERALAAVSRL